MQSTTLLRRGLPALVLGVAWLAACAPEALPGDATSPQDPVEVETQSVEASDTPEPTATDTAEPTETKDAGTPSPSETRHSEPSSASAADEEGAVPLTNPTVQKAIADLAARLGVAEDQIELVSYEAVVWPDGSLGCPEPGMTYTQVQQDGALIVLTYGGQTYEYHSGGGRDPFLCEQPQLFVPEPPLKGTEELLLPPKETDDEVLPPPRFDK